MADERTFNWNMPFDVDPDETEIEVRYSYSPGTGRRRHAHDPDDDPPIIEDVRIMRNGKVTHEAGIGPSLLQTLIEACWDDVKRRMPQR